MEIALQLKQAELDQQQSLAKEALEQQSSMAWAEKEKIKKLQDDFAEVNSIPTLKTSLIQIEQCYVLDTVEAFPLICRM